MTVTDGDRFAVAVAKFDEASALVQQGRKIIEYLFEVGENNVEIPERIRAVESHMRDNTDGHDDGPCDPVIQQEDEEIECLE